MLRISNQVHLFLLNQSGVRMIFHSKIKCINMKVLLVSLTMLVILVVMNTGCAKKTASAKEESVSEDKLLKETISSKDDERVNDNILSRETALTIGKEIFPHKIIGKFSFVSYTYYWASLDFRRDEYSEYFVSQGLLEDKAEYIRPYPNDLRLPPRANIYRVNRSITSKAKQYMIDGLDICTTGLSGYLHSIEIDGENLGYGRKMGCNVREGEITITGIDRIFQETNSSEAEIYYQVRFDATPFYGRRFIQNDGPCGERTWPLRMEKTNETLRDKGVYIISLKAKKYDDGWRLEKSKIYK